MKRLQYILLCGLLLLAVACEKDTLPMNFSPALTTGEASDIYRVGATLSGTIQKSDGVVVQDYGFLISELQSMAEYMEIKTTSTESTFEVMVQNLEPGKKYYYCAYANSGYSIARGEIKEFSTTDSNAPVFSELVVNDKDEKSFTVASTILDEGGSDLILCGFCWKLAESGAAEPTVEDKVSNVSAQSSAISARIKDLTPNKNYLVRAYGINAKGVGYGKTIAVSTNNATVPAVSSITPVDSTALSVSVKASILSAGESEISEMGFCWSAENQEPTTANMKYDAINQKERPDFMYNIDNLNPETTYYIRAYAVNSQGTGYGDVYIHTTGKPVVAGIYSLQDLLDFRDAVNAGRRDVWEKMQDSNGVINIFSNIDASAVGNWIMIDGISSDMIIDGNNHTISNLRMETVDDNGIGFVDNNSGIIRNLTLSGKVIMARDAVSSASGMASNSGFNGAFCNYNGGTIQNCHNYMDVIATGKDIEFGGICWRTSGKVENCSNHASITANRIGGIAVYVDGSEGKVINCTNYGTLKSIIGGSGIGGIVESLWGGMISGCVNEGKVLTEERRGSFGGICAMTYQGSSVLNCRNNGEVSGGAFTGGIVGSIQFNNVKVNGCLNAGSVSADMQAGGICGAVAYYGNVAPLTGVIVSGNTNTGNIVSKDNSSGGICGYLLRIDNTFDFTNNVNGGTVDGVAGTDANAVGLDQRDLPINNEQ